MASAAGMENGAHTVPGRNPRRRARKDAEEGGSLRLQPHRKRHKPTANGGPSVPQEPALANGYEPMEASPSSMSIPLRGNRSPQPTSDYQNNLELDIFAENESYCVGQLPALPKELRDSKEGGFI